MRALRTQLLLGATLATVIVLGTAGATLYMLIRSTLSVEFDRAMAAQAGALAALTEQDGPWLEFEVTPGAFPAFDRSALPDYFQIWQHDGIVCVRSPSLGAFDLAHTSGPVGAPVYADVTLPDGRAGRTLCLTFTPRLDSGDVRTPPPARLTLARGTEDLRSTLAQIRNLLLAVGLLAVLLSAGMLAMVVSRGLRPVRRLSARLGAMDARDLTARLPTRDMPDELRPVVERLNDLLGRLEAAFARERRFTGDVAHELRTPLSGLRAKLELGLSRTRSAAHYQTLADDALGITQQMQRMVESLLQLARADAGQLEARQISVNISALVQQCWWEVEKIAQQRQLHVTLQIAPDIEVDTDPELLALVIRNLLDNAVTHSDVGAALEVVTAASDHEIKLSVANTGAAIAPTDAEHVFDRFWRGPRQSPDTGRHVGLGLPLCKAVVTQLGGIIDVESTDNGRFACSVSLPSQPRNHASG